MRRLTDSEQRTVRIAVVGLAIYLCLFYGPSMWRNLFSGGSQQQQLAQEVEAFRQSLRPYENRLLRLEKLKGEFAFEPSALPKLELVAEANAAIQNSAKSSGVKLGPIRESAGRASAKELVSMRLEGMGTLPSVLAWLNRLENLDYPLLIDAIQLEADPRKPNQLKLSMTVVILDFEQWKKKERPYV